MRRAYQIALFCGAFPLTCGTLVFLLWLVTRWDWLMTAGIVTIIGGLQVFLIGNIALAWYRGLALRSPEVTPRQLRFRTLAAVGLLLSNFPLAVGYAVAANAVITCHTVVVHNASRQPLDNVRVVGGGCDVGFGKVQPGESIRRAFWIRRKGELVLIADFGGSRHTEMVDGYVSSDIGGSKEVTVNSNGTIGVLDTTRD
jgi:hypothetical protein